jgi:hypothetical protein
LSDNEGGKIDIYTQREPFSGRGLNVASDAFAPEDLVIVYASVTYNEFPVVSASVAFEIHGPANPIYNVTFLMYAQTDSSGVATINFRIGFVNEINFGEWKIAGTTNVGDGVHRDFLSFKVGWIVEIVSLRTLDESSVEQTKFELGSYVNVELGVRNIAMVEKEATLSVTVYDYLNISISSKTVDDYTIPPNSTIIYVYFSLHIPEWTSCGNATVSAGAFTARASEGGVAYCPEVSAYFMVECRDIAILSVYVYPKIVYVGDIVNVNVTVTNKGKEIESFSLGVFYNDTNLIETTYVTGLSPNANAISSFTWNTSGLRKGYYQISALASPVPGEVYVSDNTFAGDAIEIKELVHDIAVLDLVPSSNMVYAGEAVNINVIVKNDGNYVESFRVNLLYNETNIIASVYVLNLQPNVTVPVNFVLDTNTLLKGFYQLGAYAEPVLGEVDVFDNTFANGILEVRIPVHDIAILAASTSASLIYAGEILNINVTVKNKGAFTESFHVSVYYNSNVIETLSVNGLVTGAERTIVFKWGAEGVAKGDYVISAFAEPVLDEENLLDNSFQDGVVRVEVSPSGFFAPEWFWWLLLFVSALIVSVFAVWVYRRRRKKNEEAFYSGWTAWYYGYDFKAKNGGIWN